MSDLEPIVQLRPRANRDAPNRYETRSFANSPMPSTVSFDRKELHLILSIYGEKVAQGEWRDYAMDFNAHTATFSVFRRTSEVPLYRIVKDPALARKQGGYAVIAQGGFILKRGHDLAQVLKALLRRPKLSTV